MEEAKPSERDEDESSRGSASNRSSLSGPTKKSFRPATRIRNRSPIRRCLDPIPYRIWPMWIGWTMQRNQSPRQVYTDHLNRCKIMIYLPLRYKNLYIYL